MAESNDEIVIKRSSKREKPKQNPEKSPKEMNVSLYSRIFAVLLMIFSDLLFLSIISYTQKDELNAKITLSELLTIFSSDSMIRIKAETTQNWLGLTGAVLSDLMINGTIGYIIVFLPVFLFVWGLNIYKSFEIPDKLIRNTIIYFLFGISFSSLLGALRNFETFSTIDKEWLGAIGLFAGSLMSKLLSPFGATLFFLIALFLLVYFGTNINWKPIFAKVWEISRLIYRKSIALFRFLFVKVKDFEKINKELLSEELPQDKQEEESIAETVETATESKTTGQTEVQENIVATEVKQEQPKQPELKINIKNPFKEQAPPIAPLGLRKIDVESQFVDKSVSKIKQIESVGLSNQAHQDSESQVAQSDEETVANETAEPKDVAPSKQIAMESERTGTKDEIKEKETNEYFPVEDSSELPEIDEALIVKPKTAKPLQEDIDEAVIRPKPIEIKPTAPDKPKPLIIEVEEPAPEDEPVLNTPLGVAIHDEDIRYVPPGVQLLDTSSEEIRVSDEELRMNARILQEKLETFKIYIENLTVTPGPVVTQYEFVPAAGIKISRIESLADDLAMALKARGIRIIAPIPGRGTVGVEIPNQHPSVVRFSNVVNTAKFYESKAHLPIALGKTISGEVVVADLTKAPHLLIAGSTGSGKSVGINTIINSLLFRMHPRDLKFVIIDPKKVELQQYSRLRYHFLAMSPDIQDAIVTNPQDAVAILKSTVLEMENRYNILAMVGQRNIADYNAKVRAGAYKHIKEFDHRPMPYIVVVVDELADLMLTASREVEEPIIRLAQMARAVGIHLIIATQRPSVDVITGIIKANFPARIAYLVASKIDSRTILDISGAEQLLGNGDMLFLPSGSPKPIRIQNAFISTDEVENVCNFIGKQSGYSKPYMLPSLLEDKSSSGSIAAEDRDPLFEEAARLVVQLQQASVSLIQRRLKVGYARAGRIIDELEDAGIVGPNEGSKARTVLLESEAELERIL